MLVMGKLLFQRRENALLYGVRYENSPAADELRDIMLLQW
jgi:hypothetical protein